MRTRKTPPCPEDHQDQHRSWCTPAHTPDLSVCVREAFVVPTGPPDVDLSAWTFAPPASATRGRVVVDGSGVALELSTEEAPSFAQALLAAAEQSLTP